MVVGTCSLLDPAGGIYPSVDHPSISSAMRPERFWIRVKEVPSGCWEWQGASNQFGYGSVRVDGEIIKTHRYAYMLTKGPIPDGMHICHACDNPKCVNPDHLWAGTHKENMADAARKGRMMSKMPEWMQGENHPRAKLTNTQRELAVERRLAGEMYKTIAKDYGVSPVAIIKVCQKAGITKRKAA
jgi:hypothetical protein